MQWLVIGISGVTCGGKTTLAHSLREYFQSSHAATLWHIPYKIGMVHLISQDDYFLPVDDARHVWLEEINAINFELLTSLDMQQMLTDIAWLMRGSFVQPQQQQQQQQVVANNDFDMLPQTQHQQNLAQSNLYYTHFRNNRYGAHVGENVVVDAGGGLNKTMKNNFNHKTPPPPQQQQLNLVEHTKIVNVLIIEGFIIFNQPELYKLCNIKYHFHLPYEKCFERRKKRSYDPPDVVGYFELCVWPFYEISLREYRHNKDIIYLNGEIERERIFKYVLKQIGEYFDSPLSPPTQQQQQQQLLLSLTTSSTAPTAATTMVSNEKMLNFNFRMQRHQQNLPQQQQEQLMQQFLQQQQKQQLSATPMQQ